METVDKFTQDQSTFDAPFGNPDGSRAEINDLMRDFVSFGGNAIYGGLATRENDLKARVLVGRKGSGKTIYLRRLQAYASQQEDLYADDVQQDLPTTEKVLQFCQWFPENLLTEKWMQIWRRAIISSVLNHLLFANALSQYLNKDIKDKLKTFWDENCANFTLPHSVYSHLRFYLTEHSTKNTMTQFLEDTRWEDVENIISDVLRICPPICMYIDAIDEEFKHAPLYWQRCQKGLFYIVMRLLRDARLGGRLHIVICVRDIVYAAVQTSEHATRYLGEPHIRILRWNRESLKYFLEKKIAKLDSRFKMSQDISSATVESWLGIASITNGRGTREKIDDYLLRHTRCLPRDLVTLGNQLCLAVLRQKAKGKKLNASEVRSIVARAAEKFAEEQLTICANHLASDTAPKHSAQHNYSDVYTSNDEYVRLMNNGPLKELIKLVGRELFSLADLRAAQELVSTEFEVRSDIASILWQHGLLGYVKRTGKKRTAVFYSADDFAKFSVPESEGDYIFHSILHDVVALQLAGKKLICIEE